jgi:hypothetical protein
MAEMGTLVDVEEPTHEEAAAGSKTEEILTDKEDQVEEEISDKTVVVVVPLLHEAEERPLPPMLERLPSYPPESQKLDSTPPNIQRFRRCNILGPRLFSSYETQELCTLLAIFLFLSAAFSNFIFPFDFEKTSF